MTLQELKQLLSTLLADSSNNFFTLEERVQAINNACSYINSENRLLRTVSRILMTPTNAGKLPLPQDFVSLSSGVQWETPGGVITNLERGVPLQLQGSNSSWASDVGIPTKYVLEGGNIYLNPAPSTNGYAILSYLCTPNKLLDDNDLPFYGDPRIQAYHDMIAFYAAWLLALKDRDFEASDKFMQYFQSRMIDLKENLRHTGDVSVQPVWSDTYSTV